MPDYISREAVLKMQYHAEEGCGLDNVVKARDIEALPAADVAPVVRCVDCRYGKIAKNGACLYCGCYCANVPFLHYCAYGMCKVAKDDAHAD